MTSMASSSALPSYWSAESDEEEDDNEMTPISSSVPQSLTSSDGIVMPQQRRGPGRPRKDGTTKETKETKETKPGYYIREDTPTEGGLYRYIYYGPDAPGQDAAIRLPNATP